ncbi:hypothetical protein BV898_14143 [Hypsibius exemplaris]|uniref:CAS1 domain-containing protein 1 n=1 Tax=Hypsibius exemplaris TaxID=2072580 RepID=A0A1W0W8P0_HYPEX|nr:hypothetical protein BV898_14143 [Hypsibius exemplaris]
MDATTIWRPNAGCSIRYRSHNESIECLQELSVVTANAPYIIFIGDSRLRQLRDGLILELTGNDYDFQANREAIVDPLFYKKHAASGKYYPSAGVHVWFEWFSHMDDGFGPLTNHLKKLILSDFKPSLLVMGVGVWLMRDCHRTGVSLDACVQRYSKEFEKLYPVLVELSATTKMIWLPQCAVHEKKFEHVDNINVGFTNKNM